MKRKVISRIATVPDQKHSKKWVRTAANETGSLAFIYDATADRSRWIHSVQGYTLSSGTANRQHFTVQTGNEPN